MEKIEIKVNSKRLEPLIVGNKVFRSFYNYELSPEDLERARLELGETEDVRKKSLRNLREMLSRDGIRYRTDDAYLLSFLRCKKFRCEDAYKMIRYVYSLKESYPETFRSLPSNLRTLLDKNIFAILPYRDEDGSVIFIDSFDPWKPHEQSILDLFQCFTPVGIVLTMNPACQINKIVSILDFAGTNIYHLAAMLNPKILSFWVTAWQKLYAWRIKRVLLVNCNKYVHLILRACRHMLQQKIKDRIVIVGSDMSEMHQYLDPRILPKKYGGELEESECSITDYIMNNLHCAEYDQSFP